MDHARIIGVRPQSTSSPVRHDVMTRFRPRLLSGVAGLVVLGALVHCLLGDAVENDVATVRVSRRSEASQQCVVVVEVTGKDKAPVTDATVYVWNSSGGNRAKTNSHGRARVEVGERDALSVQIDGYTVYEPWGGFDVGRGILLRVTLKRDLEPVRDPTPPKAVLSF